MLGNGVEKLIAKEDVFYGVSALCLIMGIIVGFIYETYFIWVLLVLGFVSFILFSRYSKMVDSLLAVMEVGEVSNIENKEVIEEYDEWGNISDLLEDTDGVKEVEDNTESGILVKSEIVDEFEEINRMVEEVEEKENQNIDGGMLWEDQLAAAIDQMLG